MKGLIRNRIKRWGVIDLAVILFLTWFIGLAWEDWKVPTGMKDIQERQLAMNVLQGTINASITGVSIILAAIAAVTGIRKDLDEKAKLHYRIAALLAVVSLMAGIYNMGILPQSIRQNVVYEKWIAYPLSIQIYGLFLSGLRMLLGIFSSVR